MAPVPNEALVSIDGFEAFLSGVSGDLGSVGARTRRKLSEATRSTVHRIVLSVGIWIHRE
ncbi:hypothetical protein F5X98DRAFT_336359 [Xylaria grammica]|nr:hypothetical protein F5X98DRAFT_336359 [Xylaria grammica]